jgi:MSHA biogenesis protein MshJ
MKQFWKQYADRMDAATLRERAMIFAAAVVVIVVLMNSLLIEPQLVRQKQLTREVAQRQESIRALQQQLEKMANERRASASPDDADRRKLEETRKRLAEVDVKLLEEQRRFAPPEQIGPILEEMLSRNRRLKLVDMRTLPAAPLEAGMDKGGAVKPGDAKPTADKPALAKPAGQGQIYRHGVELTVTGTYLDLLAYLKALEKLPSQMYWGRLELSVAAHPEVKLKLSVYTLSLDPAWMRV